ncbi:MAG: multicopper oxidase family protein [Gemmatimonadota bacterium]
MNNRGSATPITFINDLGSAATTNVLAYKYSTDQTLHWADPLGDEANMCNMSGMIPADLSPCAQNYAGPVPAVPHLHGGEVPPVLDGGPDTWFTSDGAYRGHGYYTFPGAAANEAIYKYPNTQEASPIWFHDHTLGATRLNVYAGLAGAYLIVDPDNPPPSSLPGPAEIVPIVLQDRMFDTNGQLFFPADSAGGVLWTPNPDHPYWVPEFVGDAVVINGKAWPYHAVQPKRYLFWFLNGSNARTYEMFLVNPVTKAMGPPLYVIGTDGGYLDKPVKIDPALGQKLVMQPGERYLVIIDFVGFGGTNLILRNTGRTPYPKGAPPKGTSVGQLMQFRVAACPAGGCPADASYNPALGGALRTPMVRLVNPATGTLAVTAQKTRLLSLNEVMGMPMTATDPVTGVLTNYPGGPLEILVNNTKWSGMSPRPYGDFTPSSLNGNTTYYSEVPKEGETEVWEIVNLTADAHPIHLHLVQFQLINRQNYNVNKYTGAYNGAFPKVAGDPVCIGGVFCPAFGPPLDYRAANNALSGGKDGGNPDITPYLQGAIQPPLPQEAGWKDTVIMYPGQVTRIAVRWAPTDLPASTTPANAFYPFDPRAGDRAYVWHCHIVDHEDNEMMRPDLVERNDNAERTVSDY